MVSAILQYHGFTLALKRLGRTNRLEIFYVRFKKKVMGQAWL